MEAVWLGIHKEKGHTIKIKGKGLASQIFRGTPNMCSHGGY